MGGAASCRSIFVIFSRKPYAPVRRNVAMGVGTKKEIKSTYSRSLAKEFKEFFGFIRRLKPPKLRNLCPSGEIFSRGNGGNGKFLTRRHEGTKIFWARCKVMQTRGNGNEKRNQENLLALLAKENREIFDFFWRLKPPKLRNLCPSGEIFFCGNENLILCLRFFFCVLEFLKNAKMALRFYKFFNSKINIMKKFIAISTLLAAGAIAANAAIVKKALLPELTTITGLTGDSAPSGWNQAIGNPSQITADAVSACLAADSQLLEAGWHWKAANHQTPGANDVSVISLTSFSLTGRNNYNGEFVAATIDLSTLLNEGDILTDLSIAFNLTGDQNSFSFSLYSVDGTTATQIGSKLTGTTSCNLTANNLSLTSGQKLFAVFNAKSGGTTFTVSDLTSSATIKAVPEPSAFGLLAGLGALALVGARRRRR